MTTQKVRKLSSALMSARMRKLVMDRWHMWFEQNKTKNLQLCYNHTVTHLESRHVRTFCIILFCKNEYYFEVTRVTPHSAHSTQH
jgi:hypothetical protein